MLLDKELDNARLLPELEKLRLMTDSDLAALALQERGSRHMKWALIAGSRNGKILTLKLAPGVGPAGMALRLGREYRYSLAAGSAAGAAGDHCPVMLAERLTAAAAYPLAKLNGPVSGGLLLLGRRAGGASYSDREREAAVECLAAVEAALGGITAGEMS